MTPHPGGVYDAVLDFDPGAWRACAAPSSTAPRPHSPTIAANRQRVRSELGWEVGVIETGHDPMVSAPERWRADCSSWRSDPPGRLGPGGGRREFRT